MGRSREEQSGGRKRLRRDEDESYERKLLALEERKVLALESISKSLEIIATQGVQLNPKELEKQGVQGENGSFIW